MESNIYKKLSNMRAALSKEQFVTFEDLTLLVSKKAKDYKLLPLYCFYGEVATLSIVDLDNIEESIKFHIPVELIGVERAKRELYKMAFDVDFKNAKEMITARQYGVLIEKIHSLNLDVKEILDRYKIKSLADMTCDVYQRCMSALDKTNRQQP